VVKKRVKTPKYLLGFTMNALSAPAVLSLFIAIVEIFQISNDRSKRTMSR